jgi:hypothetical protein
MTDDPRLWENHRGQRKIVLLLAKRPLTANDLTFTAQKSGTDGNSVSMKYTNAGGTQTLLITITGNDIDIRLRTTSGTINSTSAEIQSALYGDPGVMALIRSAAHASGNDGSGVVTALAKTNLAGATVRR